MKRIYFLIQTITAMSILISCSKVEEKRSDDVFITIYNECQARIKIYDISENRQYLSDIYDCSYISFLPIRLDRGKYKLVAETIYGKKAEKIFTKGWASTSVIIEFP